MQKNNLIISIVIALITAGGGFYGGIQYQKSKQPNFPIGTNRQELGPTARRPVSGIIANVDDNTITLTTQDGSSSIIIFSDSTTINKSSEGSASDLITGENIVVMGEEQSDGTISALTISVGGSMQNTNPPMAPENN